MLQGLIETLQEQCLSDNGGVIVTSKKILMMCKNQHSRPSDPLSGERPET